MEQLQCMPALWTSVAMPGVLYGVNMIPLSNSASSSLEVIQNQVGKAALGVPQSTANPVVKVELGWKPLQLLVDEAILCFFHWVSAPTFQGSSLVKTCMAWALPSPTGPYSFYLLKLARSYQVWFATSTLSHLRLFMLA